MSGSRHPGQVLGQVTRNATATPAITEDLTGTWTYQQGANSYVLTAAQVDIIKIIEIGQATTLNMMAEYDAKNPEALRRLVASGITLRAFPNEVVEALYRASVELYSEISARNPAFKAIYESQVAFRDLNYQYHQVADFQFDAMMLRLRRRS